MTQVFATPRYVFTSALQKNPLTRKDLNARLAFDNMYRVTLASLTKFEAVTLYMGPIKRTLAPTDLMVILRDCKNRMEKDRLGIEDFGFFFRILRRIVRAAKKKRGANIAVQELMRLRKMAYQDSPESEATSPVPAKQAKPNGHWRSGLATSLKARSKPKVIARPVRGCQYQHPGSGDRCGAACNGIRCEVHTFEP